ncbi:MAG TPA: RIO1 family regulatory kinase/ATPase [Chloroflexota bacterium]|nr:RIO1 family regulatory kinase/ATPase [Chloroflexota bacterium]
MSLHDDLEDALRTFIDSGLIAAVLGVVKSGKEATVYCCRANTASRLNEAYARLRSPLLAAKVYRPRERRTFRDDSLYRTGRVILDRRQRRAAAHKTAYGRRVLFGTWVDAELETLRRLHAAGADVPAPVAGSGRAIVMEYVGDESGPAPLLLHAALERQAAPALFERVLHNVRLFLACDRVHADLSPYNILAWNGTLRVIDFPQAVDPRTNPDAYTLLRRDIEHVCRFFARYGVRADPVHLAEHLWDWYLDGGPATGSYGVGDERQGATR